jgi:uncharacterized RDD family membrane protein YckC
MATLSSQPIQLPAQEIGKKFSIRAAAYIIDMIIEFAFTYVVSIVEAFFILLVYQLMYGKMPLIGPPQTGCLEYIEGFAISLIYFVVFESLFGATPGKLILGMRVIMKNGEACTFKSALVRGLYRLLDGLVFGLPAYTHMKPPAYYRIGDDRADTMVVGSKSPLIHDSKEWWWFLVAAAIVGFTYLVIYFFINWSVIIQ